MARTDNMGKKSQSIYALKSAVLRYVEAKLREDVFHKILFDNFDKLQPKKQYDYNIGIIIETDKCGNFTINTASHLQEKENAD